MIKFSSTTVALFFVCALTTALLVRADSPLVPPKPIPDQTASENGMLAESVPPINGHIVCNRGDGAHGVAIYSYNNGNASLRCDVRCYYHVDDKNGILACSVNVPAKAQGVLLCSKGDASKIYTVTSPGSYDCH
jgi:hypothetical protein